MTNNRNNPFARLGRTFLAALAALAMPALAAVEVGREAPNFTGTDSDGRSIGLSQYRGKTVILEWTNHDCPYVVKHYRSGNMQALQKEAAAKGFVWLSVISSAPHQQGHVSGAEANNLTRTRNAAPAAVILDERGDIGRSYGAKTTPHMYIVNPAGQLVYMGGIDSIPTTDEADIARATNYVRLAMQSIADGNPIAQNVTRPYGCSVKY
jgi:peroxiredoxin